MLFYPDNKRLAFNKKLILFAEKIKNKKDKFELDLFEKFRTVAETGDVNRTRVFLDKSILRYENAEAVRAC